MDGDGKPVLVKEPKVEFIDDGPGKPVGINRFIGRRPIFAFGNSDGDQQMLEWTAAGDGARFMGLVHHTDAEREWAYDRNSHVGKLDKALDEANGEGLDRRRHEDGLERGVPAGEVTEDAMQFSANMKQCGSAFLSACVLAGFALIAVARAESIAPEEARAIAKEAYIYGFPMVDNYRIQHAYFVDTKNPEYKAPWNQIANIPRVYTPADTAIQTPNSDTPYSMVGMDLRAEPLVLTVPPIEKDRYFSVQLIDAYTFNFAYIGSRATGNDGGSFVIAGPGWKGETPKGVKEVIRSETELGFAAYRTQLFNPADIDNVKKIQAGYKVQPLSAFLGQPPPAAAPAIDFIKPLTAADERKSLEFFNILNFILQFTPTVPSETELMARFAKIGVGAGKTFDPNSLPPEIKTAIEQGVADAWADLASVKKEVDAGTVTLGPALRHAGVLEEQLPLPHGRRRARHLRQLEAGGACIRPMPSMPRVKSSTAPTATPCISRLAQLPPVNAFWSLTMYDLPAKPARGQSDQSLPAQFADAAAVREGRRRRPDILCAERVAGKG